MSNPTVPSIDINLEFLRKEAKSLLKQCRSENLMHSAAFARSSRDWPNSDERAAPKSVWPMFTTRWRASADIPVGGNSKVHGPTVFAGFSNPARTARCRKVSGPGVGASPIRCVRNRS